MSDPHAIVSPYRIQFEYTISSLVHKVHVYVKDAALSAGDYNIFDRSTSDFDLAWESCATHYAQDIASTCDSTITMGSAILQHRVGSVWDSVASAVPTITPNVGVSFTTPGSQMTVTLRDTGLNRFKLTLMEAHEAAPQHFITPGGGSSGMDAFIADMDFDATNGFAGWKWITSKYALFMLAHPFVAATCDLNRKILRARGLK